MISQARKILEEALALPDEERRLVAIALRDSLETADPADDIDAAWREALVRRAQRVESSKSVLLNGNEGAHQRRPTGSNRSMKSALDPLGWG